MPPWMLKAAVQGALSLLPEPQKWNRYLQTHVTRSLDLGDEYFMEKWQQAEHHVATLARLRGEKTPRFSALELGTGWFPVIPIGLALCGASQVWSVDQQDLLAADKVLATLTQYHKLAQRGWVTLRDPDAMPRLARVIERAAGRSARELLAALGITSVVGDARRLDLAAGTIDLLVSNNTLEHVPGPVIVEIFREFRRLARPSGIMSHYIDMADHYAGFDRSITVYNFLRFGGRTWRLFNNSLQYQNRLRVSDFRELHARAGWTVVDEENRAESPEVLRRIKLAREFLAYPEDDLLVYKSWMTSLPTA